MWFHCSEFPSDIQTDTPCMNYSVYEELKVAQNPFKPSNPVCCLWCPQMHCSCRLVLYSKLQLWNPPLTDWEWGPAGRTAGLQSCLLNPQLPCTSQGFWGKFVYLWPLEAHKGCSSPLPAGQCDTFQDILGAPAGHLQPLQLVPEVVPNQCQGLIRSRGSLEGTCKPHLGEATPAVLLYELHCSETQRDTHRISFLQFCEGKHSSRSNRLLSLFLSGLEHSKDGGFDTLSEQPFEWLSSISMCQLLYSPPLYCYHAKSCEIETSMHNIWQLIVPATKKYLHEC